MNIAQKIIENNAPHPYRIAIGFRKQEAWKELSWKKFSQLIFKTANALKAAGVQDGDRVAIYADNSPEWMVFDLATMAIGGVTVPIYSTSTIAQAEHIINDSQAKIILVGNQKQYDECFELLKVNTFLKTIIIAKNSVFGNKEQTYFLQEFIEEASEEIEFSPKEESDIATLIYTSGTTGRPKGVVLTHGNFYKCIVAHFEFFKFKNFERESSLAFLPLTHVFERSWTLLCFYGGAKVSFLENPKEIAETLPLVKPTMMCAVPRFFQKIYAGVKDMQEKASPLKAKIFNWALAVGGEVAHYRRQNKAMPSALKLKNALAESLVFSKLKAKLGGRLWFMPCGGAAISGEITEFFDAMGLHVTVGYGLTETTATLTAFPLTNYRHGTAGVPLPGVEIKIGENDEILAKGNGIMQGYYNMPEATDKVFTADGWFKTGDCGKIDENGNLLVTDRIKDLMKTSNGKYIAPQVIENQMTNNAAIQQILVVAEGRQFVSALVVPDFEYLKQIMEQQGLAHLAVEVAVRHEKIIAFYRDEINKNQSNLANFERIKKFELMPREFSIEEGEMTPTLKLKRKVILDKYQHEIESIYS